MLGFFRKMFIRRQGQIKFELVNLPKIILNPFCPRDFIQDASFEALKESIAHYGILVPLILSKESKFYILVCGRRRLEAAKQLSFKKVPAIVKRMSRIEIIEASILENLHRKPFATIDLYYGLATLQSWSEKGPPIESIGKMMGIDQKQIAEALDISKLNFIIQSALKSQKINDAQARILQEIKDQKILSEIIDIIHINKLTDEEVKSLVERVLHKEPEFVCAEGGIHFHSRGCPYALLIPENRKRKIYSKTEAKKLGKIACMYCL